MATLFSVSSEAPSLGTAFRSFGLYFVNRVSSFNSVLLGTPFIIGPKSLLWDMLAVVNLTSITLPVWLFFPHRDVEAKMRVAVYNLNDSTTHSLASYVKIHFLKKFTKSPKQNGNVKLCVQRAAESHTYYSHASLNNGDMF